MPQHDDVAKREFIAHVCHQFRSPLATIRTCAETLRKECKNDVAKVALLKTTERHVVRLTRLMDDLLVLYSLTDDRARAESQEIVLTAMVKDFATSIAPLIRARRLSLKMNIPPEVTVCAKKILLYQVFQNICENAIKYSPRGRQINIEAHTCDNQILICIRDRGIGVPDTERAHIFKPFYRTELARSIDPAGMGLGLSIAQKIVEFFGGKIWAETNEPTGSSFLFTLPCQLGGGKSHELSEALRRRLLSQNVYKR